MQFLCSFALYLLVLVPPAFVWNCCRKPSNICLPSHCHYRNPAAYPPNHRLLASYFTTLIRPKSTVDLDGRFLVLHSSQSRVLSLPVHGHCRLPVHLLQWDSPRPPPLVTRLSGPSHYPRAPSLSVICYKPEPGFYVVQTRNPGLEKDLRVWNPYWQPNCPNFRLWEIK